MIKVKTTFSCFILLLGTFLFFSCTQHPEQSTTPDGSKWTVLTESAFSVRYPADWELDRSGIMGTNFILFSPLESLTDDFRENVNFMIQDLRANPLDLDAYMELSENQLKSMVTDVEILEKTQKQAHGREYGTLVYTGKDGEYNLRFEQHFWIDSGYVYLLTCTAEADQFEKYARVCRKILRSFRLTV